MDQIGNLLLISTQHSTQPSTAISDLVHFILHCTGCTATLESDVVMDQDAITETLEELQAGFDGVKLTILN